MDARESSGNGERRTQSGRTDGLRKRGAIKSSAFAAWLPPQVVRRASIVCALALFAVPALAQNFTHPNPPPGYNLPSVPQCGKIGQSVTLDLSTTTIGADPRWMVTGPNPPFTMSPTHTTLSAWTALPNNWVQPVQTVQTTADQSAPAGIYKYTIWFNLPCVPRSYKNLILSGQFAADNDAKIYFNGNLLPANCADCFSGTGVGFATTPNQFVHGLNALSVVVVNREIYTGVAVRAALRGVCTQIKCELPKTGLLKICKVAGPGVAVGTPFNFTAGSFPPVTVPAGPAPGGTCAIGPKFPIGTTVTVAEAMQSGVIVSSITVAPPSQLVGTPNLAAGTVNVTIGSGVTDVTYTDQKSTGFLEICKRGEAKGDFQFTVNPGPGSLGPFVVPQGGCSPAIQVFAGPVTIQETPTPGTAMADCTTIPASLQGQCDTKALTSIVTVNAGNVSTATIAFITNQPVGGGGGPGGNATEKRR